MRVDVDLLEELARHWRMQSAPIAARLADGLSDHDLDDLVRPLGLRVTGEARVWWSWHDGARDASIVFGGGKTFPSLARCVELAKAMRRIAEEVADGHQLVGAARDEMARDVWDWNWLPLSFDGTGGTLVFDAGAGRDWYETPIFYRGVDDGATAVPVSASIGDLVTYWIGLLESGAARYDQEAGKWVLDEQKLPADFDEHVL